PVRRTVRLARNPVEPQEPAGDRPCAGDQDGAAGTDAGRAEGNGHRDAVGLAVVPAKAGTHTPWPSLLEQTRLRPACKTIAAGGYGPCVRRDDSGESVPLP